MIIFNTTYCVSDKCYDSFLRWLKEQHLPEMLAHEAFLESKVSRVLTEEQEGKTISVQLISPDLDAIANWNDAHGDKYRMEMASLFDAEVLFFASYMEVMDGI